MFDKLNLLQLNTATRLAMKWIKILPFIIEGMFMKLLKLLVSLVFVSSVTVANAESLSTFDGEMLTVPVVNTVDQIGKYERVQFKVAKDGRWDLIGFTEPRQATVETISINILESFPVQVHVVINGYFPNGCFGLGETHIVKQDDQFNVVVNSTTLQTLELVACTQALVPFEVRVPLEVNGLFAGVYQVDVNGISDSFELSVDNF